MPDGAPIPAFAAVGIEIEYMIVDRRTLDVRPLAGELLAQMAGHATGDVAVGPLGWSNELAAHVVELKNRTPDAALAPLADAFQQQIDHANALLATCDAKLMPTAMHPWMDPRRETQLWSHGDDTVYRAFDRLFDCRRHGWANLQSMHVNLPFAGDAQFARLHAAIRCVLPLIPAIAASSPFADGERKPLLDYRLEVYRTNAAAVPRITGDVIPENADTQDEYRARILAPMYADVAPLDPDGVLQHEWLNSRGAIARFDRSAIEIRLVDTQECAHADLAVAAAIVGAVRALYEERWAPFAAQRNRSSASLAALLAACMRDGESTPIDDGGFLRLFGMPPRSCSAGALWSHLLDTLSADPANEWCRHAWRTLAQRGTLARRIAAAVATPVTRERLHAVYARLCDCLAEGRLFSPS